jgi:hypothetical protein
VNTIAPDSHPVFDQTRYQLLIEDGYKDRMRFWSSAQLIECVEKEHDFHFPSRLKLPNPFDQKQTVDFVLFELAITNPRLDVQMRESTPTTTTTTTTTPSSSSDATLSSHIVVPTTSAGKATGSRKRTKSGTGPAHRALKLLTKSRRATPVEIYQPAPPLQGAHAAFKEKQQMLLASSSSSSSTALTRVGNSTTKTTTTPATIPHSNLEVYKLLKQRDTETYEQFVTHYKSVSADIKAMFSMLFDEITNERKHNTTAATANAKVIQAFARIDLATHLAEHAS